MKSAFVYLCLLILSNAVAQSQKLSGKIINELRQPVHDAVISFVNSNRFTVSSASGDFTIDQPNGGTATLFISAPGYAAKMILVTQSRQDLDTVIVLVRDFKKLGEVIISAQKTEEPLQSAPLAVTVVDQKTVQQRQLWTAKELTALAPGLNVSNPGDNRNVISIRGITSTSYDPAIATYIDGVGQFSLDTYFAELLDIERIEVLRGPQGTLYGRNAMGGVISIISKPPVNNMSGYFESNIANHGSQRYMAYLNWPVLKNKLYVRFAGLYTHSNGFYSNYDNTDFDKRHSAMGSLSVKYRINNRWLISVNLKKQFNRNQGAFPLVFGKEEALAHPYRITQDAVAEMSDDLSNNSLDISYAGIRFNFVSLTAYQSNYRFYTRPLDADFSTIDGISIYNNFGRKWNNAKVITHETRITSTANSLIKWVTGIYLFSQTNPVRQSTVYGRDAGMLGSSDSMFAIINTSTGKNRGLAVYGHLSYPFTKKIVFTAGLRYDHEKKSLDVLSEYQKNFTFPLRADTAAEAHFNVLSPQLGILYQIAANNRIYFNYAKGFRAGGLSQLSSDPSQVPLLAYLPEHSQSFELGIKNMFLQNRLIFNLAFFYISVKDAQIPVLVLPDAITRTQNAGRLRSRGLESELIAKPAKGFTVSHSLGLVHAVYQNSIAYLGGQEIDLGGKRQIFTPSATSALAVLYEYYPGRNERSKLGCGIEWFYTGKQYYDLPNTLFQSSHHSLNANLAFAYKAFQIKCWMKNLTDTHWIDYAYDFGAVHLADPRTYGVGLSVKL